MSNIILRILGFIFAVFVYMALGAIILEFFLVMLRKLKRFKFVDFYIEKVLVREQVEHPTFEVLTWCTLFWPILFFMHIIVIPVTLFSYIIKNCFNKVDEKLDDESEVKE